MTFRKATAREWLIFAGICVVCFPLGYAGFGQAEKVYARKYGRSLSRVVTGQPCTPCEKQAMERLASAKGTS